MPMDLLLHPLLPVKLMKMTRFLAAVLLFSQQLPKRGRYPRRIICWSAFCILAAAFTPILSYSLLYITTVFLTEHILCLLTVLVCCKAGWTMALYIASAAYCTEHIASMLDSLVALTMPDVLQYIVTQRMNWEILLNFLVTSVAALVLVYCFLFRRCRLTESNTLSSHAMVLIAFISIGINLYMNLFYRTVFPEQSTLQSLFTFALNIICSVFLLKIQHGILRESQMESRLQITAMLWEQAREQYRISKENIDAINIKCHDLKHRLLALKGAASHQDYADMLEAIDSYGSEIETNNEVLNVVFQEKNFQCRKQGIQFACIIDGAVLNFMDNTDLYVLFGNLIDNCIEAVTRLPEGAVKLIQVTIHREKGFAIIRTENSYAGQLKWAGGRLHTSKEDTQNHGYGMLSIENIVHKYDGRYTLRTEDNVFCMNIVLPLKSVFSKQ